MRKSWLILLIALIVVGNAGASSSIDYIVPDPTDVSRGIIETEHLAIYQYTLQNELLTFQAVCSYSRVTGIKAYAVEIDYKSWRAAKVDSVALALDGAPFMIRPDTPPTRTVAATGSGNEMREHLSMQTTVESIRRIANATAIEIAVYAKKNIEGARFIKNYQAILLEFCDKAESFEPILVSEEEIKAVPKPVPIASVSRNLASPVTWNDFQYMKYSQRADIFLYAATANFFAGLATWRLADLYGDAAKMSDDLGIGDNGSRSASSYYRVVSVSAFITTAAFIYGSLTADAKAKEFMDVSLKPQASANGYYGFNLAVNL